MNCHGMLALLLLPVLPASALAQVKKADDVLPAKTVTLKTEEITAAQALKQLSEQTGIPLADRRAFDKDKKIRIDLARSGFWEALDAIAKKAGGNVSLYQPDNVLALVEGKLPALPSSYHNIFRSVVKRVSSVRDFGTGAHQSQIAVEFAWEPSFQPFYLEVKSYQATFTPDGEGKETQASGKLPGQAPVHGRHGIELELRLDAPDRSVPEIKTLKGEFNIIGPKQMVTVVFKDLKDGGPARKEMVDGVFVTLKELSVLEASKLWSVELELTQPPGGPIFESFQSWLTNNKIHLENPKTKRTIAAQPFEQILRQTSREAVVKYFFEADENGPPLGKPADYNLHCRVPGQIVEVCVPFEFRNILLP